MSTWREGCQIESLVTKELAVANSDRKLKSFEMRAGVQIDSSVQTHLTHSGLQPENGGNATP